jgi:hypothetical protein
MRHARSKLSWVACCVVLVCTAARVSAQDDDDEETEAAASEDAAEPEVQPQAASAADSPAAPPSWFFGAYFQGQFVPSFLLTLLLDDAPTVGGVGVGITATHRSSSGGPSLVLGLGWAGYGFDGPFRMKGDPTTDTEWLQSTLSFLHARVQLLWSSDLVKGTLSFEYGVGADLGLVLGSMTRSEAYPVLGGGYAPCARPLTPDPMYCELPQTLGAGTDQYNQEGAHYGVVEKRVPPVMLIPMLPVLALRYTPLPALAIKLDAAFGLMQFSVGLSAAYGVNL